jgi:hypothetical protein
MEPTPVAVMPTSGAGFSRVKSGVLVFMVFYRRGSLWALGTRHIHAKEEDAGLEYAIVGLGLVAFSACFVAQPTGVADCLGEAHAPGIVAENPPNKALHAKPYARRWFIGIVVFHRGSDRAGSVSFVVSEKPKPRLLGFLHRRQDSVPTTEQSFRKAPTHFGR